MPEPMSPQEKRKYWGIILVVLSIIFIFAGDNTGPLALKHATVTIMVFIGGIAFLICSRR